MRNLWQALTLLLTLCIHGSVFGSNVATQTITFSVDPISEISLSGDPPPLVATQATAGNNPAEVVDGSTFYAVTSNGFSEKLMCCLNASMPTGTTLCVTVAAPEGATSFPDMDMDVSNQNIVTGISQVAQSNLQITYIFEATASAGVVSSTSRIVTFTLSP
jgi:hypothetical protein